MGKVSVACDLRELRDLSGLSLEETCARTENVVGFGRLSSAERGLYDLSEEQHQAVVSVLHSAIRARAARIARVLTPRQTAPNARVAAGA